jgi:hypothetical protein
MMNDQEFERAIVNAVAGDIQAITDILIQFEPLISNSSFIDGRFDDDCRSHLLEAAFKAIPKFKL